MAKPHYIAHLNTEQTLQLQQSIDRMAGELKKAGLLERAVKARIQTNLSDIYERKRVACPYEVLRIQRWSLKHLLDAFDEGEYLFFVTIGRPQDRTPLGKLKSFDPENLFRKFSSGITKLKLHGITNLRAFYVLEVQLTRPIKSVPFFEPHLHAIVQGATKQQLREALKVRKSAASTYRNRPVHIKPVTDLAGVVGYCTKFTPKLQTQYSMDGSLRWRENRLPAEYLPEWCRFFCRFTPGEVLKFESISGQELDRAFTAELSLDRSEIERRRQ